jgi:hypothetical protein
MAPQFLGVPPRPQPLGSLAAASKALGNSQSEQPNLDIQPPAERTDAPLCGIHHSPMTWQKGRKGYFWSCHKKMADGSWCHYKPASI